ncbi:MAG TPA: hypothetical protein PKI03_05820, partial [Pseudomonadota bacterium]|nr:hypothetical protein [Pseudomonadota bacterium]
MGLSDGFVGLLVGDGAALLGAGLLGVGLLGMGLLGVGLLRGVAATPGLGSGDGERGGSTGAVGGTGSATSGGGLGLVAVLM